MANNIVFIDRLINNKNNFSVGRGGNKVIGLIVHTEGVPETSKIIGNTDGTERFVRYMQSNTRRVSANFYIPFSGCIVRVVDQSSTAYHSGDLFTNKTTIGVELQDNGYWRTGQKYTKAQIEALGKLMAWMHETYGMPLKAYEVHGIRPHNQVVPGRACPGIFPWLHSLEFAKDLVVKNTELKLYRIMKKNKQVAAFELRDNAFDSWYSDKEQTVLYNEINITQEFLNMSNTLEKQIAELNTEVKDLKDSLTKAKDEDMTIIRELRERVTKYQALEKSLFYKIYSFITSWLTSKLTLKR